jgi:AcrR family transcriptional regulator
MTGEERRGEIVRVAVRLFSQRGFRGTTTKEIAQAAGVSEAIIFRHFATKEELYHAILDYKACAGGVAELCEAVADAVARKDDRAVFETLAEALLEHHEQDIEFHRLLSHAALDGHQLVQMFLDRTVRQLYEFLGSYVRERQRDGAFREVSPPIVVRAFLGMIIHHSIHNNLWDTQRTLLDMTNERAALEFTDILLGGIVAAGATTENCKRATPRNGLGKNEHGSGKKKQAK